MTPLKILQDARRNKQVLLFSFLITLLALAGIFYLGLVRQHYIVKSGIEAFTARLNNEFVDNELIADAVGVRFYQQRQAKLCGDLSQFIHQRDGSYAINAHQQNIDNHSGAIVAKYPGLEALCIYAATGFIAEKINQINGNNFYAHRYIVSHDGTFFYWFNAADAGRFNFTSSRMVVNPQEFFPQAPRYYDRLLMKDNATKGLSSTGIYEDKITGTSGYSIVSYIYDLTQRGLGYDIVGYLVYDHTQIELREQLHTAFMEKVPQFVNIYIHNRQGKGNICLNGQCDEQSVTGAYKLSDKYEVCYGISAHKFLFLSPFGLITLLLFFPLFWGIRKFILQLLTRQDYKNYTDILTGCLNRKALEVARRNGLSGYAVIVVDCNNFKFINDNLGHDTGDRALKVVAQRMLHAIRHGVDFVVRTGGDEFVVFLYRTSPEQAQKVAARIAAQVELHRFVEQGIVVPLSVSYGVAEVSDDLDAAINRADERMYQMKRAEHAVRGPAKNR